MEFNLDFKLTFRERDGFINLLKNDPFSEPMQRVLELLDKGALTQQTLETTLISFNIASVKAVKSDLMDIVLCYAKLVLTERELTENEEFNIEWLKDVFQIKEGDFYQYKRAQIAEVLQDQLSIMYADNRIDKNESLLKVRLQQLFDLGYDQFLEFVNAYDKMALLRGADILELDTVYLR
jgi:hypothetical protein